MRIYITAPYPCRDAARLLALALTNEPGIRVTSRWLTDHGTPDVCEAAALEDLADIDAAEAVMVLNFPGWIDRGTGGRHTELGYAIARGKPILLVGPRTQVFHYHSFVRQIDWPDAVATTLALLPTLI